jgi:16S rRNA (guanine(966)-N(2))-methyltransferase RsmD
MRILAGSLHNRQIKIPSTGEIRPTSSKLRGQVFNICQGGLEGGYALDLFAGSGAIGIEAISRGSVHCTFVEHNHQTVLTLKANLSQLHLESVTRVLTADIHRALFTLSSTLHPFSFVYIDPPYALIEPLLAILQTIDSQLPLVLGAYVFLETRKKAFTPDPLPTLSLISRRSSGDSDLWHFEKT